MAMTPCTKKSTKKFENAHLKARPKPTERIKDITPETRYKRRNDTHIFTLTLSSSLFDVAVKIAIRF
jgi:hypothetical protein